MGRGDRKTKKGKTAIRSYGNKRPHTLKVAAKTGAVVKKAAPAAKPAAAAVKKPVAAAPKKKA
jgi:30S ribosomal protein S31